ncbi:hypothetical protein HDE_01154 [Halotydeus destructor]|nr:hypothetical protein HDE_01154 [Halotydeus destructor]
MTNMNSSVYVVFALLGAILVKTSLAADACTAGMTEEKFQKHQECFKKLDADFDAKMKKWTECFSKINSVPLDKVPTKFADIKAVACTDANKANKEKFDQCFHGGPKPEMSADMKMNSMRYEVYILMSLLGAILLGTCADGEACDADLTEEKWLKSEECFKKLTADYDNINKKWQTCFTQVYSVAKVPAKFAEIKALVCGDANKANKEKMDKCFFGGPAPEMSADMKVIN